MLLDLPVMSDEGIKSANECWRLWELLTGIPMRGLLPKERGDIERFFVAVQKQVIEQGKSKAVYGSLTPTPPVIAWRAHRNNI